MPIGLAQVLPDAEFFEKMIGDIRLLWKVMHEGKDLAKHGKLKGEVGNLHHQLIILDRMEKRANILKNKVETRLNGIEQALVSKLNEVKRYRPATRDDKKRVDEFAKMIIEGIKTIRRIKAEVRVEERKDIRRARFLLRRAA